MNVTREEALFALALELLDGLNGVVLKGFFPSVHVGSGPIAINSADRDSAVFAGFGERLFHQPWLRIISVD